MTSLSFKTSYCFNVLLEGWCSSTADFFFFSLVWHTEANCVFFVSQRTKTFNSIVGFFRKKYWVLSLLVTSLVHELSGERPGPSKLEFMFFAETGWWGALFSDLIHLHQRSETGSNSFHLCTIRSSLVLPLQCSALRRTKYDDNIPERDAAHQYPPPFAEMSAQLKMRTNIIA